MAEMLKNNSQLNNLSLSGNQLTDTTVEKIVDGLITTNRTLTNLDLYNNTNITDISVQEFVNLFKTQRKFKLFKLYSCGFTRNGISKIQKAASNISGFHL